MYGIGVFEIFLILLVLLLFFKPAEIFSLFRRLGAWYRKAQRLEEELRSEWDADSADENGKFGFDAYNSEKEGEDL